MKRSRRHKYLQIPAFILIYTIMHVVSVPENSVQKDEQVSKVNTGENNRTMSEHHHEVLRHLGSHMDVATGNHKGGSDTASSAKGTENNDTLKMSEHHHEIIRHLGHHFGVATGTHQADSGSEAKVTEVKVNDTSKNLEHHKEILKHFGTHFGVATGTHQFHEGQNLSDKILADSKNRTKSSNNTVSVKKEPTAVPEKIKANSSSNANSTSDDLNCTAPAIRQFPKPLMSPATRRHGGLIIHIIVAAYMFLGLAIVCDQYFVASLDRICEELKMSPDVAGATFMAAGSSAPELATVIIGVFFAKDDIGISGVIGSAVFNIMFVISCCGLCSTAVVYLNWWPLVRDCFFYAVSILVMLVVIYDKTISWGESLVMLITYLFYCIVLHFNTPLERWAQTWPVPFKSPVPTEQSGLVSYKTLESDGKIQNYGMDTWSPEKPQESLDQGMKNFGMEWSPEKHQQEDFGNRLSGPALNQTTADPTPVAPPAPTGPIKQDYYKPKEYDPAAQINPLIKPEGAGLYTRATWMLVYPIHWLSRKTMPDCRSEKYRNWYPFTFFVSMVWISFYSYFMVWMITIIGYTLGIPDTVMGLTFVAAGVSVPDALSSIAVIKEG
nr:probable sodium/potassium/calcium exchanger CG1090 [Leptinotarsa decemlineata]